MGWGYDGYDLIEGIGCTQHLTQEIVHFSVIDMVQEGGSSDPYGSACKGYAAMVIC